MTILYQTLLICKRAFWYTFWFSLAINILTLVGSLYSLQVLDRVLNSHSLETLAVLTGIILAANGCLAVLSGVRTMILAQIGAWVENSLAPLVFQKTLKVNAVFKSVSGSQILRELGQIKGFITGPALPAFLDAPWTPIYLIVIACIHPSLAYLTAVGAAVLLVLGYLNDKKNTEAFTKGGEAAVKSLGMLDIAVRNADVIEAMGMTPHILNQWHKEHLKSVEWTMAGAHINTAISSFTKFIRLLIQVATTAFGAYWVIKGEMTAGGMIATSILAGKALAPFDMAISVWKTVISARKSYVKVEDFIEKTPALERGMPLPPPQGKIELEKVVYALPGMQIPIIKGISFAVNPGDQIGIIGPSGSGKSTLGKLAIGLWKPSNGTARLDGADVYSGHREDIGPFIGYLPQDIELFNGTIRENIGRMDPDAPADKVLEAAQKAQVHELILRLPNGYDTEIGLWGGKLSPGQRQRIALARAFYGNPAVIVLDEPNSNLDTEGEMALSVALHTMRKDGTTVVIISHRPNLLRAVDKILVLIDGQVKAFGPPDEVFQSFAAAAPLPQGKEDAL